MYCLACDARLSSVAKALAELVTPAPDRLICHGHASFEEKFFDVTQAQLEAEIPAYCATDDASRETVAVIERFRFLHHAILRDRLRNLTKPSWLIATRARARTVWSPCRPVLRMLSAGLPNGVGKTFNIRPAMEGMGCPNEWPVYLCHFK
jgi:hypothetical protein